MATETTVRVTRARYGGFVATFRWNGETNRVFFENAIELAAELADECVDPQAIESVLDGFESMEWSDSDYPLMLDADTGAYDYPPSPLWDWLAATLTVGAVTAPWILLFIVGRVVLGMLS